ncbi:antibiotic biosynthesis monooxygenase family protein [Actinomadura sp. 6N118]|uniref:antibiotic biosynthesis monooxygenase family protein n=1 Tax=Actinomadura sp. 6N118 TaxID=3375151 RepID=UPI0037A50209
MTVGFVAVHYPRPEHFEEFVGRTHQVRETLEGRPGYQSSEVWVTPDGDAVVTMGRFESEEDLQAALAAARDLGAIVGFDERERKPRQTFMLVQK